MTEERARVGLVLSAGASVRFGGAPKALARVGDGSALQRIHSLLESAGVPWVRVVLGPHSDEIRAGLPRSVTARIDWVEHRDWERGRTGSIQAGLAGLPEDADVVLWPVDHPFVSSSTLPVLLGIAREDPMAVWVLPEFRGHGGHPVILAPPTRASIFELGPDQPLRDLLPRFGPQVRRVPVEDAGVVANLNTWEEYAAARAAGLPWEDRSWTER